MLRDPNVPSFGVEELDNLAGRSKTITSVFYAEGKPLVSLERGLHWPSAIRSSLRAADQLQAFASDNAHEAPTNVDPAAFLSRPRRRLDRCTLGKEFSKMKPCGGASWRAGEPSTCVSRSARG